MPQQSTFAEMTVDDGADFVLSQLTTAQKVYAGNPERGMYRGFAALHDLMDANMILPYVDTDEPWEERDGGHHIREDFTRWCNLVSDEVSRRLVKTWDEIQ